ncbi:MAG TPA: hypothetical protein VF412_16850 [Bdellovibrio sp.]|uniref:hypothetical protein n=1 Tax=Bdellovibrio sp. TaxID=28201 RepID=UPI002F0A2797
MPIKTFMMFVFGVTLSIQSVASEIHNGDTKIEERSRTVSSKVLKVSECYDNNLDRWATISFHTLSEDTVEKYLVSVQKRCSLGLVNCNTTETLINASSRSNKVVSNNEIKFTYDLRSPEEREPAMHQCSAERAKYLLELQSHQ